MNLKKGTAFILKARPFSEKDYLVTLFSEEYGLLNVLAKGVKGSTKGWCGKFLLFSRIEFECNATRSSSFLSKVISIDIVKTYNIVDPESIVLASFVSEVVIKLLPDDHPVDRIWKLIDEAFGLLEKCDNEEQRNFTPIILLKVLSILGFAPGFSHCSRCQKKFSKILQACWLDSGDLFCSQCYKGKCNLPFLAIKILSFWQSSALRASVMVEVEDKERILIFDLLSQELQKHIKGNLRSLKMLKDFNLV